MVTLQPIQKYLFGKAEIKNCTFLYIKANSVARPDKGDRMKSRALYIVLIILANFSIIFSAQWRTVANMKEARGEHANAMANGKIFVLTGFHKDHSKSFHGEIYNPSTNSWSTFDIKGTGNRTMWNFNHTTAGNSVYGNEIWLCGGKYGNGGGVKDVWVFSVQDKTFRKGPSLPSAHWGGPSAVCGDELHVFGGYGGSSSATKHHWVLNLKNESAGWKTEPEQPKALGHHSAATMGKKIYVVGGETNHSHTGETGLMQVYDTESNTWDTSLPKCPEARTHHEWATFIYNGEMWLVGGTDTNRNPIGQNTIYIFNPDTKKWRKFEINLPKKCVSNGARIINNTLYVFGGGYDSWWPPVTTTYALDIDQSGATSATSKRAVKTYNNTAVHISRCGNSLEITFQQKSSFDVALYGINGQMIGKTVGHNGIARLNTPLSGYVWQTAILTIDGKAVPMLRK